MATYRNRVEWKGEHKGFTECQNGVGLDFSAPPDLHGLPGVLTPEDAFGAAVPTPTRFLVEELKPAIDRRYRTRSGPADTFVMGSSMGGLISLYAHSEYPRVFGGAACLSTHWPAADGAVIDYAEKALPQAGQHRLYYDFGTAGLDAQYEPYQKRMDEVLRAHGYTAGQDWVTRRFEGAGHDEASWNARLDVPLTLPAREVAAVRPARPWRLLC